MPLLKGTWAKRAYLSRFAECRRPQVPRGNVPPASDQCNERWPRPAPRRVGKKLRGTPPPKKYARQAGTRYRSFSSNSSTIKTAPSVVTFPPVEVLSLFPASSGCDFLLFWGLHHARIGRRFDCGKPETWVVVAQATFVLTPFLQDAVPNHRRAPKNPAFCSRDLGNSGANFPGQRLCRKTAVLTAGAPKHDWWQPP